MSVRHEEPHKFESKWFRPYQIMEKMMYGLQDPNGKLLRLYISSAKTLKKLWVSPAAKDRLQHRNITTEYVDSDNPQNMELLEQYLFKDDDARICQTPTDSRPRYFECNN